MNYHSLDQLPVNQPRVPQLPVVSSVFQFFIFYLRKHCIGFIFTFSTSSYFIQTYHFLYFLPRLNLYDVGVSPLHFQQEKIGPSPFFDEAPEDFTTDEERVGRSAELEDSETEHPNSEYYKEWILQNLG